MTLAPGMKLGPYEILTAIGAGGMGEVYKAKDTWMDWINLETGARAPWQILTPPDPVGIARSVDRLKSFLQTLRNPNPMTRFALLALVLPCVLAAQTDPALLHARKLLKSTILIDGHNDLPWEIRVDPKAPRDVEAYDLRKKTVSPDVMRDVLDESKAPVIFSHSSARALVDHPRNVPDEILSRMAANGGVVMVTFIPSFVNQKVKTWSEGLEKAAKGVGFDAEFQQLEAEYIKANGPSPKASLKDVADHIDHVAKTAGHDHVGIASDFWGGETPVGLEDVSKYPELFAELIRRGWEDADLRKLAGENLLRTFAKAEATAKRIQKERPPSTATIEALDGKK